jgi:hypothetical protein
MQTRMNIVTTVTAVLLAAGNLAGAAEQGAPGASAAAPAESANPLRASAATPAPVPYAPSMPDMMNIGVQPRHEKLGMAGHARNWKYSAYEVRELRTAFMRVARTAPAQDGWDTLAMFNSIIMTPLKNVEDAIKAEDGRAFDRHYAELTEACNACHRAMNRDYIVIRVPRENAYPNQVFTR